MLINADNELALFEIYCAITLNTAPLNTFETH